MTNRLLAAILTAGWPGAGEVHARADSVPSANTTITFQSVADPLHPITVGPRDEVGKPTVGDKAIKGILGNLLGSSRKNPGSKGPRTKRDPTRKLEATEIRKKDIGLEASARARWTDDGLLVSTLIDESDGKGTFQSIFLQDCKGRRLYPASLEIYKIWAEHSISVSWSKTTTVNGRTVNRETGGWSESWTEDFGPSGQVRDGKQQDMPAIWQQVGYDRAQGGVRQLGAYFKLAPETLRAMGDVALIAHVTRPGQDPVITQPLNWIVSGTNPQQPQLLHPDTPAPAVAGPESTAWSDWSKRCLNRSPA